VKDLRLLFAMQTRQTILNLDPSRTVADFSWHFFENGSTLGQQGSEQGAILRDEEFSLGARITLERDCHAAPFAITCGIYGWMLHTRFFSAQDEADSEYERMKNALAAILEAADKTAEFDGGRKVLLEGCSKFVETYP
jgi:hypothetical protein